MYCRKCGKEIKDRVFFDAFSGGFLCGDCFNGEGREINAATYFALKNIAAGKAATNEETLFALRLLDFYVKKVKVILD